MATNEIGICPQFFQTPGRLYEQDKPSVNPTRILNRLAQLPLRLLCCALIAKLGVSFANGEETSSGPHSRYGGYENKWYEQSPRQPLISTEKGLSDIDAPTIGYRPLDPSTTVQWPEGLRVIVYSPLRTQGGERISNEVVSYLRKLEHLFRRVDRTFTVIYATSIEEMDRVTSDVSSFNVTIRVIPVAPYAFNIREIFEKTDEAKRVINIDELATELMARDLSLWEVSQEINRSDYDVGDYRKLDQHLYSLRKLWRLSRHDSEKLRRSDSIYVTPMPAQVTKRLEDFDASYLVRNLSKLASCTSFTVFSHATGAGEFASIDIGLGEGMANRQGSSFKIKEELNDDETSNSALKCIVNSVNALFGFYIDFNQRADDIEHLSLSTIEKLLTQNQKEEPRSE